MRKPRRAWLLQVLCSLCLAGVVLPWPEVGAAPAAFPAQRPRARGASGLVQRTLRLLATSRPEHRNTVRVLIYGQSISEQRWGAEVERSLRRRYPSAHLILENRALGGFHSQLLVKAAETDLYPFYPDLLVFHVYGAHDRYEDIVRRVRERTTAEILLQTDHVTRPEDLNEERDPARLPLGESEWGAFMNYAFLPQLEKRYEAAVCEQREAWKGYLRMHALEPAALLKDEVHLNAHGEWFMGECVKDCLRRAPELGPSPAEGWVRTLEIGKDVHVRNGVLRVTFVGNRIDAIADTRESAAHAALSTAGSRAPALAEITIDGRKPSEHAELYGLTRAKGQPGGKWPPVFDIGSRAPPLLERWTLSVTTESLKPPIYRFSLAGSVTGPDGEGRSDKTFVSRSERVVIEPDDWVADYALGLAGVSPFPDSFSVSWDVVPRFVDRFESPPDPGRGIEAAVTLAQGLSNESHVLEMRWNPEGPRGSLRALRVYAPPLRAGTTAASDSDQP